MQTDVVRYHGLDALRGFAMLLGIVIHAALPYMPGLEWFWPSDKDSSNVIWFLQVFIHSWRMPLFFIVSGFFTHLVISRKSWKHWWANRALRIALPLVIFTPLMALALPWIFAFGFSKDGTVNLFYSNDGQPWHLWFLWHLLIFTAASFIFVPISRLKLGFISSAASKSADLFSSVFFRSNVPILFITLVTFMTANTGAELIINPIATALYFGLGFSLYGNQKLFQKLKNNWKYYILISIPVFVGLIVVTKLTLGWDWSDPRWELWEFPITLLKIAPGVLFSFGLIGLAESKLTSPNNIIRFISDSAYWVYLVHLPIVCFITFYMLRFTWPAEIKFIIAITLAAVLCLVTYKLFVRSTFIGLLLNGKTYPWRKT
jgi:glucan biosynthesis protein C